MEEPEWLSVAYEFSYNGEIHGAPTLYITRLLPQPVLDAISGQYRMLAEPTDQPPTDDELRRGFAHAQAVICTLTDRIDASLLSHATKLKVIANYAGRLQQYRSSCRRAHAASS